MINSAKSLLLVSLCFALLDPAAEAQEGGASVFYGQGVHAYFAGQDDRAMEMLTMAVENSTGDPRPYYYRGLLSDRLGDREAAIADFQRGAELEATSPSPLIGIGNALQRIQGPLRMELERQRQLAKFAAMLSRTETPEPPTEVPEPPAETPEPYEDIQQEAPARIIADEPLMAPPPLLDAPSSRVPDFDQPNSLWQRGGGG